MKNPPDEFCTHLFFASAIILIFGGLFLHILSRLIKFNTNCLRVPTTDFARQKYTTRRDNPNSSKLSWKVIKKPPKGHTKKIPFFMNNFNGSDRLHTLFKSGIFNPL